MVQTTYLNLKKEKKEWIRSNVIEMFVEKDFEDVKIRDLAEKCGISTGSFYKYFESKEDMYLYFFCQTEEKIINEEYKQKSSLFTNTPYLDLRTILTPVEIAFNRTWLKIPINILNKFYFDGYAKNLNKKTIQELTQLYEEKKLNPYFDKEMVVFFYLTSMYNFNIYARNHNIVDNNQYTQLKKLYFEKIIYKGMFSDDFYHANF